MYREYSRNREYVFMYGLLGIASLEHGDYFQCTVLIQKLVSVVHTILKLADSWQKKNPIFHLTPWKIWWISSPNEHVNCGFCLLWQCCFRLRLTPGFCCRKVESGGITKCNEAQHTWCSTKWCFQSSLSSLDFISPLYHYQPPQPIRKFLPSLQFSFVNERCSPGVLSKIVRGF